MDNTVVTATYVDAPVDAVWQRIGTPQGINHELWPYLRMTVPSAMRGKSLDTVPVGKPIGRSWFLLFGLVPIDFDDITVAERDPGRRFLERSRMFSLPQWEHERTLTPQGSGTEVRDRVSFTMRSPQKHIPGMPAAVRASIGFLFRHRHRRLARYFAANPVRRVATAETDAADASRPAAS